MKKILSLLILLFLTLPVTWAQPTFVVKNIEFQGLQHLSPATVESYLPIKRGQTLPPAKTAAVLRALYQTGFFESISLSKEGNTLIIRVVERPTIGQLKVTGNSVIPTDKLTTAMKSMDIAEGHVYNPALLERIKQSLLNQYYQLGRYNARVEVSATPMSRNRVSVRVTISEGLVAKIRRISIIGNKAFDEKTLVKQLDITPSGLFTFITQTDRYSEEKLEANLDKLRSYYMDHGYLRVEIKSSQAQITPDRKAVYITIVVNEGEVYTVKNYELIGKFVVPKTTLEKQISIKPGDTFSRQKIIDSQKNVTKFLGDKGYLFATISIRPQINDKTREVMLVFDVTPGKRVYVRHVTFSDNNRTNDVVLRREIMQWESAPISTSKLEDSKHRLSLLPYIKEVDMSVKPVADTDDQVDVNYRVKEDSSAQATFKIGYSQVQHMILGAGFNQKNVFGTGNTFGINLSRSKYEQFYGVDFTNPYYTADGISRSFSFSVSRVDPSAIDNVNSGYVTNEYDLGVLYGIPIGQETGAYNRVMVGATYQDTMITLNKSRQYISNQINSFINENGRHFQELDIRLGYSRDSRDKAIFPTRGAIQTIFLDTFAPLTSSSLAFYTFNYHGKWYRPLSDDFILLNRADFGYGNGFSGVNKFPFFRNYYAGGIGTVRGFEDYTMGPQDSNGQAFGGNILVDASLGLIFPNYLSDNLRTSLFVDAGNVYSSQDNRSFGGDSTNSGPIRFSVGLEADILTPFGPIELSLAKPIRRGDDKERPFQFAIGANF